MGVLSALILILWFFRPMVLLSIFAFVCPPMWSLNKKVDYPHLHHVIMASCILIVGVLKYFLMFGGFVLFDSDPLELSSYGAFVHFCFSLSAHVIAWRECWWSTPVSCDHGIVHLDCWSIKIFSHFGGVCLVWFWSFGAFVLWCFCPMIAWWECWFSTPVLGHGIIHLDCWSITKGSESKRTKPPKMRKYFLIFGGFVRFDSDPLVLSSYGAFVHFSFSL